MFHKMGCCVTKPEKQSEVNVIDPLPEPVVPPIVFKKIEPEATYLVPSDV